MGGHRQHIYDSMHTNGDATGNSCSPLAYTIQNPISLPLHEVTTDNVHVDVNVHQRIM